MSITYFLYLFLFSGLEYSLTFLVHQRFNYTRQVTSLSLILSLVNGALILSSSPQYAAREDVPFHWYHNGTCTRWVNIT